MTDSVPAEAANAPSTNAPAAPAAARNAKPSRNNGRGRPRSGPGPAASAPAGQQRPPRTVHPALEQLAALHPRLFGAEFLPLKRGIFQDLLEAHPGAFERDALKEALGLHTRSTPYLQAIAAARPRHDLQGQPVEDLAPEHVHHALVELWRRRLNRTPEAERDALRTQWRSRVVRAFEASGLDREAYAERVRTRDQAAGALLDEALAEAGERAAKDEALLRAFEAGNTTVEAFADMYGLDPRHASQLIEGARRRRAVNAAAAERAATAAAATAADPTAGGAEAASVGDADTNTNTDIADVDAAADGTDGTDGTDGAAPPAVRPD